MSKWGELVVAPQREWLPYVPYGKYRDQYETDVVHRVNIIPINTINTVTVAVTINGLIKLSAFNAHICPPKYLVSF